MNLDERVLVTNIQRFSLHDGDGIRTTVFLKGCSLYCPWCANPENIRNEVETGSGDAGSRETFGRYLTLQNLYDEVKKDEHFYETKGGVTFSGGEPLLFMEKLVPLLEKFKRDGISICIETSLFGTMESVALACAYCNQIFVDLKILDENQCRTITGGDLNSFLDNLTHVDSVFENLTFRIPLVKPYVTNDENLRKIINLVKKLSHKKVQLIKGHNLAEKKYSCLDKKMYPCPDLTDTELERIARQFTEDGMETEICKV
jgi:Pyruvate-formate lyase-activating enzyme